MDYFEIAFNACDGDCTFVRKPFNSSKMATSVQQVFSNGTTEMLWTCLERGGDDYLISYGTGSDPMAPGTEMVSHTFTDTGITDEYQYFGFGQSPGSGEASVFSFDGVFHDV